MVAHLEFYQCDQNGGEPFLRLAVLHPFWEQPSETIAVRQTSSTDRCNSWRTKGDCLNATALAAKLKRSTFFVWKLEAGERQLNVLEFIEIARALNVKPSALMAKIEA
jgi:hypothetical protein